MNMIVINANISGLKSQNENNANSKLNTAATKTPTLVGAD